MTKLKEEFFKLLPPTIYFFVALHIVAFVRVLMLEGTGLAPSSSVSIAVASLILGKAVLIADMLPLINRFPNKPLIYNVAWKTVIYLLISAVIHYLERLIDFWRQAGSFVAGNLSPGPPARDCQSHFAAAPGASFTGCMDCCHDCSARDRDPDLYPSR